MLDILKNKGKSPFSPFLVCQNYNFLERLILMFLHLTYNILLWMVVLFSTPETESIRDGKNEKKIPVKRKILNINKKGQKYNI